MTVYEENKVLEERLLKATQLLQQWLKEYGTVPGKKERDRKKNEFLISQYQKTNFRK
jgi:hypothetical protein